MIDAGVIGIRGEWSDVEARAKVSQFVAWAKAQMASIGSGSPAMANAGSGGYYNRVGGGGNLTAAGGAPGGGGGLGGFRPFSFDAEAEQVRGGLRTLARALYGQAMALGGSSIGSGSVGSPAIEAAAANAGGVGVAQGMASGLMRRLGRAGGVYAAWRLVNYSASAINREMIEREDVDRMLGRNDQEGAVRSQLEEVRGVRSNWIQRFSRMPFQYAAKGVIWAQNKIGLPKLTMWTDSEVQENLEAATESFSAKRWSNKISDHVRQQRQSGAMTLTSGYRSSMLQAKFVESNASILVQGYKEHADTLHDTGERAMVLAQAKGIAGAAAFQANAIRFRARQDRDTIAMGLGYDIDEQNLRNAFMPHGAQALGIFANTAMHVREMMISSTPENAELARRLGVAQAEGLRTQMIMAGHGSVGNPFAEAMGPTAGTGRETLTSILKVLQDIADKLSNMSLGDLGGISDNPLDN